MGYESGPFERPVRRPLTLLALVGALASCDSPADGYAEQFAMLERSDAAPAELCRYASLTAEAYFKERDSENFVAWEEKRKSVCGTSESQHATLAGSLSFPSDYIPEDMQVCAQEVASKAVFCNSTRQGDEYRLRVSPGTYVVWAQTDDAADVRAFYSKAVKCGLSVDCTDHSPVRVTVKANETVTGIDPGDWFAGPTSAQAEVRETSAPANAGLPSKNESWSQAEATLISEWLELNERCRGGTDPADVEIACSERDGPASRKLAAADICYGRENEFGYQHTMHRCGPGSSRLD